MYSLFFFRRFPLARKGCDGSFIIKMIQCNSVILVETRIYLWHKADFDHITYLANSLADEFITKYDENTPVENL